MVHVRDVLAGKTISGIYAVRVKKPPQPYKEKPGCWFEFRIGDHTGEIGLKFWGGPESGKTEQVYQSIAENDVVWVKGICRVHNGVPQVSVSDTEGELRKCAPGEYEPQQFILKTEKDTEVMYASLRTIISTVKNKPLHTLLCSFFDDPAFASAFRQAPAAMTYHQNWIGGLLEHVLNVAAICEAVCAIHPGLNRDLVITGALLHDIGKVREFELSSTIRISKEGQLLGHIVLGYEMVKEHIENGFDPDLKNKVLHLILSHQGKHEFQSPKEPMLPEAVALHQADECDSQTAYVLQQKRAANTESPWIWDPKTRKTIYLQ